RSGRACIFLAATAGFRLRLQRIFRPQSLLAATSIFPQCCPEGTVLRGETGYKSITEWGPREGYCEATYSSGGRHFCDYGGFGFRGGHAVEGAASGFGL